MGELAEEVKLWDTPAIGAYLLWRFTDGYTKGHPQGEAPIGLLHFIALAILTNAQLSKHISNKRDGLGSYIKGFEDNKSIDRLLGIHKRIDDRKKHTLRCIDFAITNGLLIWDCESGKIFSRHISISPSRRNNLKNHVKQDGNKAEILGRWFSEHNLTTITCYLRVIL